MLVSIYEYAYEYVNKLMNMNIWTRRIYDDENKWVAVEKMICYFATYSEALLLLDLSSKEGLHLRTLWICKK